MPSARYVTCYGKRTFETGASVRPAILGKLGLSVFAFTLVTTWAVSQAYEGVSLGRPPAASTRMKLDKFLDGMKSFRLDEPARKLSAALGGGTGGTVPAHGMGVEQKRPGACARPTIHKIGCGGQI